MILLLGIPSEPPLAMVAEAVDRQGSEYELWSQRDITRTSMTGTKLVVDGATIDLESVSAVYVRLTDYLTLPELEDGDQEKLRQAEHLHRNLFAWLSSTEALVVNPIHAMASNASKPYQAQLISSCGFNVPDTLVTNDPSSARAFIARHPGGVVYKSTSAIRSIVSRLDEEDLLRLEQIANCPTQLQRFVPGEDVRVHVVGSEVYATAISSASDDYRYSAREGESASLRAIELDDALAARCIRLSEELSLPFCGIDLRIGEEGTFCFEANPSPAFSYYEAHTGQPIADAVARLLTTE